MPFTVPVSAVAVVAASTVAATAPNSTVMPATMSALP